MKLPSIQFYPGDWFKDLGVQSLTYEEKGIWFEMLMYMFQSEQCGRLVLNGQPMSDEDMANLLHLEVAKLKQTLKQLLSKGVASKDEFGAIVNRRMVADDKLRKIRAISGSLGGKQTSSKRQANVKQKSTPSSSSSSSSSKKKEVSKKEKEPFFKPTSKQVEEYAHSIGFSLNGGKFVDFYESKGWLIGKSPMKDWQAAVRTWKTKENESSPQERPHLAPQGEKGLEFIKRAREQAEVS